MGRPEMHHSSVGNAEGKRSLERPSVDGREILELAVNEYPALYINFHSAS
jgi:hypothetical protein